MKSNSFIKRQKEEARKKKQAEKKVKKLSKSKEETKGNWEDMLAFVDIDGNLSSEPQPIIQEASSKSSN